MVNRLWLNIRNRAWGWTCLCFGLGAIFLLLCGLTAWQEFHHASWARLDVPVQKHEWKTLYLAPKKWSPENFASPSDPKLWRSPTNRGQPEHARRVDGAAGGVLWLGKRFSEEELARAYFTQANVLFLGYFSGRFRIYIDGAPIMAGDGVWQSEPLMIPLSMKRLQTGKPLYLAVELADGDRAISPDRMGEGVGEGFVSPMTAQVLVRSLLWRVHSEPLLYAALFFVLGTVAVFGWMNQRGRQEYALFGAYAFHQALVQLVRMDGAAATLESLLGPTSQIRFDLSLVLWEGLLGLLFGVSFFMRGRKSWLVPFVFLAIVASVLPWLGAGSAWSMESWMQGLQLWYVPMAGLAGVVFLLFAKSAPDQRKDLIHLALALSLVSMLDWVEAFAFGTSGFRFEQLRVINFGVLVVFTLGIALEERRRQRQRDELSALKRVGLAGFLERHEGDPNRESLVG